MKDKVIEHGGWCDQERSLVLGGYLLYPSGHGHGGWIDSSGMTWGYDCVDDVVTLSMDDIIIIIIIVKNGQRETTHHKYPPPRAWPP
jgi:hypothetical protein